jgi:hypothetical protein
MNNKQIACCSGLPSFWMKLLGNRHVNKRDDV